MLIIRPRFDFAVDSNCNHHCSWCFILGYAGTSDDVEHLVSWWYWWSWLDKASHRGHYKKGGFFHKRRKQTVQLWGKMAGEMWNFPGLCVSWMFYLPATSARQVRKLPCCLMSQVPKDVRCNWRARICHARPQHEQRLTPCWPIFCFSLWWEKTPAGRVRQIPALGRWGDHPQRT